MICVGARGFRNVIKKKKKVVVYRAAKLAASCRHCLLHPHFRGRVGKRKGQPLGLFPLFTAAGDGKGKPGPPPCSAPPGPFPRPSQEESGSSRLRTPDGAGRGRPDPTPLLAHSLPSLPCHLFGGWHGGSGQEPGPVPPGASARWCRRSAPRGGPDGAAGPGVAALPAPAPLPGSGRGRAQGPRLAPTAPTHGGAAAKAGLGASVSKLLEAAMGCLLLPAFFVAWSIE